MGEKGPSAMLEERIQEVTLANEEFYRAFESLDIGKMDKIWAQKEYVTCIHPGWSIKEGWPKVRDSWVVIFNNVFSMSFALSDVQIQVAADVAWVTCTENITSRHGDNTQNSRVVATNLYERMDESWKIIHHHGSPLME